MIQFEINVKQMNYLKGGSAKALQINLLINILRFN